jgi:hypothetical protein
MAVIALPSGRKVRAVEWRLQQPAQVNRSAYTGSRKVMGLPGGARWSATVEFVPFKNDAAVRAWRGFLAALEGQVHTFYLPVLDEQHGGANPTATVAAGASAATLSSAIGLEAGQFLTFTLASGAKQMVVLTADMDGTLASFRPPLREATTGTVESIAPYAEVALTADTVAWTAQPGRMFALSSIEVEEAY